MLSNKMGLAVCAFLLTAAWGGLDTSLALGETTSAAPERTVAAAQMSENLEINGTITSSQAVDLLLQHNQEIAALNWQIKAREAAALQAVLLPNPELNVEVGNFNGNGALADFDSAETTFTLSQLIELGGKRSLRRELAGLEIESSALEYQTRRLDLVADTRLTFIKVLAAQEHLRVAEEQFKVAEEISNTVQARVQAGKVSPIESTKALIALSTSRINLNKAKRNLATARKTLALFWGSNEPLFSEAVGQLMTLKAKRPTLQQLSTQLDNHPKIKYLAVAVEQGRRKVKQAEASTVPDLTISGGYRNFEENGEHAFVAGFSIPLPIFDRNQGGIAEAGHDLSRAQLELAATRNSMTTELNIVYQELLTAEHEATSLRDEVFPEAQSAFEAVKEGYRQGKFSYLEVLDAQKTLFEVTMNRIDVLSAYHSENVELKRLAGLDSDS